MKKISAIFLSLFLLVSSFNSAFAATEVKVKVKGLVCAFCARNIEKSFLKNEAVEKVKADLDTKIVTIDLKEGQQISDETVKAIITDAGYNAVKIER
ncbi:MAG TPA: heavy metal-associated domain-containing protein [Rickettsiales bacterium]|nr:heavy metal-associated domain-containing protein [Rickettsiales bacterium]